MKTRYFRRSVMQSAIQAMMASALGVSCGVWGNAVHAEELSGKRIDNGRVDWHAVMPPTEAEPAVAYALPSGVTRGDLATMKAQASQLPASAPSIKVMLNDSVADATFVSGKAELTAETRITSVYLRRPDSCLVAIRACPKHVRWPWRPT